MGYASFTSLLTSTEFPAHSVHVGGANSATVDRGRLATLLAVAAYFAAVLYHRFVLHQFVLHWFVLLYTPQKISAATRTIRFDVRNPP